MNKKKEKASKMIDKVLSERQASIFDVLKMKKYYEAGVCDVYDLVVTFCFYEKKKAPTK